MCECTLRVPQGDVGIKGDVGETGEDGDVGEKVEEWELIMHVCF